MIDLTRDPVAVAPDLLGAVLWHEVPGEGLVAVRLTEVEAYCGADDPASHAFRGPTARTRVMFGPAWHLYVYLSYGIHLAANLVCGADGTAGAVLLRAGEVVAGRELARSRRTPAREGGAPPPDVQLARGPGCLGQALGLRLADSGALVRPGDASAGGGQAGFGLAPGSAPGVVCRGPRVGVSQAADVTWRFWIEGDPTVSRYSRSHRAGPRP